jgi:hypothetical protein
MTVIRGSVFLLLDENLPVNAKGLLTGHEVRTVRDMGWVGTGNGLLLDAAEAAGFDVIITADKGINRQQNMASRKIALVELSTSQWADGSVRSRSHFTGAGRHCSR